MTNERMNDLQDDIIYFRSGIKKQRGTGIEMTTEQLAETVTSHICVDYLSVSTHHTGLLGAFTG